MSNFNESILFVLGNEGGYSDAKFDNGGATNFGISTRFLKQIDKDIDGDGHVTKKDALALTQETAVELYKEYFWNHYKLDRIRNLIIAQKAFDLFVNMRGKAAGRILQRACNACGASLKVDGIIGTKSFRSINSHSMFGIARATLLGEIRFEQAKHYRAIVKADKKQNKWLKGWLRRAAR